MSDVPFLKFYDFTVEREWNEGDVRYQILLYEDTTGDFPKLAYALTGYCENGKGFSALFTSSATKFFEDNKKTAEKCFDTFSYDPSMTTIDYREAWAAENDESASSSTASTASSFLTTLEGLGSFESSTLTGTGDDVIDIPCAGIPCLMTMTHDGTSIFSVHTVDASGEEVDLLVYTIGAYSGTVTSYTNFTDAKMLSIKADGPWSVTFTPMKDMPALTNGAEYYGDGIYYIDTDSLTKIHFTNNGDGVFSVNGVGLSDADLLVYEVGAYDRTVIWNEPKSFLIVKSDGAWTATW